MVLTSHGDGFISDSEEELCPLCVEEMDLSDKNFKPCPCGYQVCQFCYNNIRENPELNGRCPACRRPYDDESVEYRMVTQEEWKQDHMRQTRKEKERKQKERERKETEQTSRKHLAGMRVIQKNLVYVIGLNPNIPTDELHETLRGDSFFGQYGKIQKIVINKRNNANGNPGLGVYVTFARKEDAAKCIAAVDGSLNDGKYLRAAYGTTKYCSSYLRGHQCPNPNCMFLHEPGEEADSYTRQDLSTIRHAARQESDTPRNSVGSLPVVPVGTNSARMAAEDSGSDDHESALPPGVSWAQKASPPVTNKKLHPLNKAVLSRRSTSDLKTQTTAPPSPQLTTTVPTSIVPGTSADTHTASQEVVQKSIKQLSGVLDSLANGSYGFVFSSDLIREEELYNSSSVPTFFAFSKDPVDIDSSRESLAKFAKFFGSLNKTTTKGADDSRQATSNTQRASLSLPKSTYGSNTQNSQELLAHLMNGGKAKSLSDRMSSMSSQIVTNRALLGAEPFLAEGPFLDKKWVFNRADVLNDDAEVDTELKTSKEYLSDSENDSDTNSLFTEDRQEVPRTDELENEVEASEENNGLSVLLQNLQQSSKKKESEATLTEQELLDFVYVLEDVTHKVEVALIENAEEEATMAIKRLEEQWSDVKKRASVAAQKLVVTSVTKNALKFLDNHQVTSQRKLELVEKYLLLRNCPSVCSSIGAATSRNDLAEADDNAVLDVLSTVNIRKFYSYPDDKNKDENFVKKYDPADVEIFGCLAAGTVDIKLVEDEFTDYDDSDYADDTFSTEDKANSVEPKIASETEDDAAVSAAISAFELDGLKSALEASNEDCQKQIEFATESDTENDTAESDLSKYTLLLGKLFYTDSAELLLGMTKAESREFLKYISDVSRRSWGPDGVPTDQSFHELMENERDHIVKKLQAFCSPVLSCSEREETRKSLDLLRQHSSTLAIEAIRAAAMIG